MPEQTLPLDQYGTVTLDAGGNGTIVLGPAKSNERWDISTVAVSVSNTNFFGTVLEPIMKAYRDSVSPTSIIGGTYSGSFDSDTAFNFVVYPGRKIAFQWTGGVPGAIATVRLYGSDVFQR